MPVTLLLDHVDTLLESVSYSKDRVRNAADTPHKVRTENLARLDAAENQLRAIRQEINDSDRT